MSRTQGARRAIALAALTVGALVAAACSSSPGTGSGSGSSPSGGTAAPGTAAGRTGEFRALTYNVAGLPQGISGSNPEEYMPLIGPKLNDYDLVLTQEDFATPDPNPLPVDFYHEILRDASKHPYKPEPAVPPVMTDASRPSAVAADGLNMFSRFPVGTVTRQRWQKCFGGADTSDGGAGDCLSLKGFSMAPVTLADGVVIHVYNLHGEAGSTPTDIEASTSDYVELAAFINEHSKGQAILLGGDTNLNTRNQPVDQEIWQTFLDATGLKDVCRTITCATDPEDIDKFAFRSSSAITLEPLERLVELEKFKAPGNPEVNDGQLSDHEAISSRWRWTAAP